MIRVNDTTVDDEQKSCRFFNSIVQAAKPAFLAVDIDEANHVARGLLQSDNGDAYRAFLSYEDQKRRVRIAVALTPVRCFSEQQQDILDRLQCLSEMSRFDRDREQLLLTLRASSICWQSAQVDFTIQQIIGDLQQILADDRLKVVLGD